MPVPATLTGDSKTQVVRALSHFVQRAHPQRVRALDVYLGVVRDAVLGKEISKADWRNLHGPVADSGEVLGREEKATPQGIGHIGKGIGHVRANQVRDHTSLLTAKRRLNRGYRSLPTDRPSHEIGSLPVQPRVQPRKIQRANHTLRARCDTSTSTSKIQAISASDSCLFVIRVLVNENHPAFAELHRKYAHGFGTEWRRASRLAACWVARRPAGSSGAVSAERVISRRLHAAVFSNLACTRAGN
jgi:hypothetical protein